jgi:uroporphyrinogen-III synthase
MTADDKSLRGLRILVPRGGSWGEMVSKTLRERGATTVIAPLVDFAHTSEEDKLIDSLRRLEAGEFDWMTATSTTVVDVLAHHGAVIPKHTQVAVVGEATVAAFEAAGYQVARTPFAAENTATGLLEEWPEISTGERLRVLTLRSDAAVPVLTDGLIDRGHDVTQVVAFRTIGVPASLRVREDVESGRINAVLISSATIAREVASQFADRPTSTLLVCVGLHTQRDAEAVGLQIEGIVDEEAARALIAAVESVIDPSDMLE